jgi:hypothetical protein
MVKILIMLLTIQGEVSNTTRWAILDQYVGRACATLEVERFVTVYPQTEPMCYIQRI